MPEYTYTITLNGKRYTVKSERPLSDAQIKQAAERLRQSNAPPGARQPVNQPSGAGRVVLPRETPAARDLAGLIAQPSILRRHRNALEAARRYAPAGMSEGEIRWAALDAARRAGSQSTGSALWDAMVRPETVSPDYDAASTGKRDVGIIEGIGNVLSTPLRALTTAVLTRFGQGREFGREAGTPTTIRDYATTYAGDPTWGSVLEALAPGLPRWTRQILGITGNVILDPLNLTGAGIVGQTGRGASRTGKVLRGVQRAEQVAGRVEQAGKAMQQAGGTARRVAGRAVESGGKVVRATAQVAQREIAALRAMDRPRSERLSAALGIDPEQAEFSGSPFRVVGIPLHALLDLPAVRAAWESAQSAPAGERLNRFYQNLAQAQWLRREVAERGGDARAVSNVVEDIKRSGDEVMPATLVEALRLRREAREGDSLYQRALRFWKASKTTLNPPSMVRNFYQNFLFRYLTGELDPQRLVPAVARLLRDPNRFKELWEQTAGVETMVSDVPAGLRGLARRVVEASNRVYEGADRLASVIMGEAMGVNPRAYLLNYGEVPRTIRALAKSGIAPFISWSYFAIPGVVRGAVDHPDRLAKLLRGLTALQPDPEKRDEYIQIGSREARIGSILPLNPGDFGGEMPIIDLRQMPLYQALQGLTSTLSGRGRPWPMQDYSTNNRVVDTALFLKDFFAPPALSYYLPGIIKPAEPADRSKPYRTPRTRMDYLLGLMGFSVRPVDAQYDAYIGARRARDARRAAAGGS